MSYNNPNAPRGQQQRGSQQPQQQTPQRQQPAQQSQQPPYQYQQQAQRQPQQQPQHQTQPQQQPQQPVTQPQATAGARQQPSPTQQPRQQAGGMSQAMMGAQGMQQPQQAGMTRPTFEPARVEELIVTDVVTAQRDTPLRTVVSSMAENQVGSVVILDEDGTTPIDILTDRKVALAIEEYPNIAEMTVEELLTGDLIVGRTEMTVFEALEKLSEAKVRRLPIVDEENALQGIITLDDLLVFLGNQLEDALEVISAQSRR